MSTHTMAQHADFAGVSEMHPNAWVRFWNGGGWWKAVLLAVTYIALYLGAGRLSSAIGGDAVDGADVLSSWQSIFFELLLPLIIGSIVLVLFARSVGWLRPLFARQPVRGSWWMWIAPVLVGGAIVLRLLGTDFGAYTPAVIGSVFVTGLFIGLAEELLTRGFVVTLLRKRGYGEWAVMVLSSVVFALLHAANLFDGQPVGTVLATVVFAFGFGVVMYLTMRVTGSIVWAIVLHALTDPTTMLAVGGLDKVGGEVSPLAQIAGLSSVLCVVIALIAMIFVRGHAKSDAVTVS